VLLPIVLAVDLPQLPVPGLQRVKDALMMLGLRKDAGDHRAVVLVQVGHDDLGMVHFGLERQQKCPRGVAAGVREDGDVEQVIGVNIDRHIHIHPLPVLAVRFVVRGHLDPLFVHAHHPAAAHGPEECRHGQQLAPKLAYPAIGGLA